MVVAIAAVAALVCTVTLGGCAGGGGSSPGSASGGAASSASQTARPSRSIPIMPGRTPKRGGRVVVVGTLQRDDNGQWIVVGTVPAQAASGEIIAVIVNPTSLRGGDLAPLDNTYVRVTGTPPSGIATNSGDRRLVADGIESLSAQ